MAVWRKEGRKVKAARSICPSKNASLEDENRLRVMAIAYRARAKQARRTRLGLCAVMEI